MKENASPINRSECVEWQLFYSVCIVACAMAFLLMLFFGHPLSLTLKLVFVAALVLTLRFWTGGIVLLLAIFDLIAMRPEENGILMMVRASSWVVVTVSLLALISAYRTVREGERAPTWSRFRQLPSLLRLDNPALTRFALQLLRVLVAPLIAGLIAFAVVAILPTTDARTVYGLKPSSYRLIAIGFGLFAVVCCGWLILNELLWRSISRSQASLYLRGLVANDMFREIRSVAKRRVRARRRRR